MNLKVLRLRLGVSILVPLFLSFVPSVHATECSLAGASGGYGFTLNGVVILPTGAVPIAAIGRATIDARGNVSGAEARSVGGEYADETLQGTLSLNPNCTGTLTANFYEAGKLVRTSILSIVFDDKQQEIRMGAKVASTPRRFISACCYYR